MQQVMKVVRQFRQFCGYSANLNFFNYQERIAFSEQQIEHSLKIILNSSYFTTTQSHNENHQKTSPHSLMANAAKNLKPILYYLQCSPHQIYHQKIESILEVNSQALAKSALEVLEHYKEYLSRIVPTNITYFHFLREKDFYMHFVIVKYIILFGMSKKNMRLERKSDSEQRKQHLNGSESLSSEQSPEVRVPNNSEKSGSVSSSIFSETNSNQNSSKIHMERNLLLYRKIDKQTHKETFAILIEWLSNMVDYRNSAIFVESSTIDHLISESYLLVCGLMNRAQSDKDHSSPSQIKNYRLLSKRKSTFGLYDNPIQKKRLFNKLMFISIYVLCSTASANDSQKENSVMNDPMQIHTNHRFFLISMSISCLRKMLMENDVPDIDIFIPSFLYVDMIGFIHCPLTYEIVLRVLIFFLHENYSQEGEEKSRKNQSQENENDEQLSPANHKNQGSKSVLEVQQNELQQCRENDEEFLNQNKRKHKGQQSSLYPNSHRRQNLQISPLTELNIWGVINLIVEKYGTYNKTVIENFITRIIPQIKPSSLVRAFVIKIISQLELELHNKTINKFYQMSSYGYVLEREGNILSIEDIVMSFRYFMDFIYPNYVQEAVQQKEVVLSIGKIVDHLLKFAPQKGSTLNKELNKSSSAERQHPSQKQQESNLNASKQRGSKEVNQQNEELFESEQSDSENVETINELPQNEVRTESQTLSENEQSAPSLQHQESQSMLLMKPLSLPLEGEPSIANKHKDSLQRQENQ